MTDQLANDSSPGAADIEERPDTNSPSHNTLDHKANGPGGTRERSQIEPDLPHGAVSCHLRENQEQLIEATMHAFEQAVPAEDFAARTSVVDPIELVAAEVADRDAIDRVASRLMSTSCSLHRRGPGSLVL